MQSKDFTNLETFVAAAYLTNDLMDISIELVSRITHLSDGPSLRDELAMGLNERLVDMRCVIKDGGRLATCAMQEAIIEIGSFPRVVWSEVADAVLEAL